MHSIVYASDAEEADPGPLTSIRIPGGGEIGLYEPSHRTAYDL
jgi:hypothetical protein